MRRVNPDIRHVLIQALAVAASDYAFRELSDVCARKEAEVVAAFKAQPFVDLSPLANLATAVAWGLALERVVTEWRTWHPAARVSWDIHGDDLRLAFSVVGLGVTLQDSVWMGADLVQMAGVLFEAQRSAALAMAPYYVAPKRGGR